MKKSYTPLPEVPKDLAERYQVVMEVLSGAMTVSEGARRLQVSRNHFQSLLHRSLKGLIEGLSAKPSGRPPMPAEERAMREEAQRLQQENASLRLQVETTDRLLQVASTLVRGHTLRVKAPRAKKTPPEEE
jgi:transposase-like protein